MKLIRHSWWMIGTLLICIALVLIFATYYFRWSVTGFLNKTLWDWMQLLIIPAVLAMAAFLFNIASSRNERKITEQRYKNDQKIAEQRYKNDQEIAADKQKEDLLQTYLDRMSELLLNSHLRASTDPKDEVRYIARARTLTVLSRLDANRKRSLLQFLYESDLIKASEGGNIIRLEGADLRGADLNSRANLSRVNLSGVNLSGADLSGADLSGSSLSLADLSLANLSNADLSGADLSLANLTDADLTDADLTDADLTDADLSATAITQKQLDKTRNKR